MRRLIIIGNGFDLAHKLKTTYKDFLSYYWSKVSNNYSDELFSLNCRDSNINCSSYQELRTRLKSIDEEWLNGANTKYEFKNKFFERLNNLSSEEPHWVDIEMFYYTLLKKKFTAKNFAGILQLNNDFEVVKNEFEKYIKFVVNSKDKLENHYFADMGYIFEPIDESNGKYQLLEQKLTVESLNSLYQTSGIPREISNVQILNFNYTDTVELYFKHLKKNKEFSINHIHGEVGNLDNEIVFGFGDERDSTFADLENANQNEFLRFMKSSAYLKTRNYFDLLKFIESEKYLVEILGHSCGLSDRTLLKTIFEHKNCCYIEIYYYQKVDKSDNFNDLNMNISRHFDDKIMLRERVANKTFSKTLPQISPRIYNPS